MSISVQYSIGYSAAQSLLREHEIELENLERGMRGTRGRRYIRQQDQHRRLVEELIPRDRKRVAAQGTEER